MTISKSVILDLLPLYATGEASPDSRQLVESYLDEHPELQAVVAVMSRPFAAKEAMDPAAAMEKRSFDKTRVLLFLRSLLMAGAIFFSAAVFSVWNVGGGVKSMLVDEPEMAASFAAIGLLLWLAYFLLRRRLAGLGL